MSLSCKLALHPAGVTSVLASTDGELGITRILAVYLVTHAALLLAAFLGRSLLGYGVAEQIDTTLAALALAPPSEPIHKVGCTSSTFHTHVIICYYVH